MSGRARFRKTDRRATPVARAGKFRPKRDLSRGRTDARPEWRLVLILPAVLAGFTAPGKHRVGVTVTAGEKDAVLLDVTAWSADEAVHRAGDFLLEIGAERAPMSIQAVITRSDWPADMKTTRWITIGGDIVATRSVAKPLALVRRV